MIQLTEEQRERVKQIRDRFGTSRATWQDVGFLLSLLDSDSQAAGTDREAERVAMEGIKEGLRQRDLRAATAMRDKCVAILKRWCKCGPRIHCSFCSIRKEVESLTLEPLEPEKQ